MIESELYQFDEYEKEIINATENEEVCLREASKEEIEFYKEVARNTLNNIEDKKL